jgi:hypothetical protein
MAPPIRRRIAERNRSDPDSLRNQSAIDKKRPLQAAGCDSDCEDQRVAVATRQRDQRDVCPNPHWKLCAKLKGNSAAIPRGVQPGRWGGGGGGERN